MEVFTGYITVMCCVLLGVVLPSANETFIFLLLGYAGVASHYVKKWAEKTEREEDFKLKKSIPSILLSVITTSVLIILRKDISGFIVLTPFTAFVLGYFGNSWFFGYIENRFNNQIKNNVQNENNS